MKPILQFTAALGLAFLAPACGGSSPAGKTNAAAGASNASAVAFSSCMRAHGVAKFPDPVHGALPKLDLRTLGVSTRQFQAAQTACGDALPTHDVEDSVTECLSTGDCPQSLLHEIMTQGLSFSRCMRAHGYPAWPDPSRDPDNGAPVFDLMNVRAIDSRSAPVERVMNACWHVYSAGVRVGMRRP
jgi:hypothetical protein